MAKEIKHRDFFIPQGEVNVEKELVKKMVDFGRVDIEIAEGNSVLVYEKDGTISNVWKAKVEKKSNEGLEAVVLSN